MLIYLIIGLAWVAFLEYTATVKVQDEKLTNINRIANLLLWPIVLVLFIGGVIKFYVKEKDE